MRSPSARGRADAAAADLDVCAQEPIHAPGAIQPFGALIGVDPASGLVRCIASDAPEAGEALGRRLEDAFPAIASLDPLTRPESRHAVAERLGAATLDDGLERAVFAHAADGLVLIEVEEPQTEGVRTLDDAQNAPADFLDALDRSSSLEVITAAAARQVRRLTGFDRVLIYRFDEAWHGSVIAEIRGDALPGYLGFKFPASDIPAQARALYRVNRMRQIPDADRTPLPIRSLCDAPLDLSGALLRAVSPTHLEYMRGMGTAASMSISLIVEGRLWGLIACHHATPRRTPPAVRAACDIIGRTTALQIAALHRSDAAGERVALRTVAGRLLGAVAAETDPIRGLSARPDDLIAVANATGAAIVADGAVHRVADAPDAGQIRDIVAWLQCAHAGQGVVRTASLPLDLPGAAAVKDVACGLLAISISARLPNYVLWFRPEQVREITWGGEPGKVLADGDGRPHPRRSFAAWIETVRMTAAPWTQAEIDAALDLRTGVVEVVLKNAEEMAALSNELTRSNKELEAFSYSVSHDLRAPFATSSAMHNCSSNTRVTG